MTDEPLRANPEDRPAAPVPAAAAPPPPPNVADAAPRMRPLRPTAAPGPGWQANWSGFLLGALALIGAIAVVVLLWLASGGAPSGPGPALTEAELMEIETLLDQLGFPPGKVDGVIDSDSVAAISDFELTAGLPVDGAPSVSLLEELRAAMAELGG